MHFSVRPVLAGKENDQILTAAESDIGQCPLVALCAVVRKIVAEERNRLASAVVKLNPLAAVTVAVCNIEFVFRQEFVDSQHVA